MTVRAKFKVVRVEATETIQKNPATGVYDLSVEQRTIVMSPVYSADPTSENAKFWAASPSGEIRLGTVNPAAWQTFKLGGEYYIDFTPATP